MSSLRSAPLVAVCALANACTLDAGQGFATMKSGELELAPVSNGATVTTDRGYRIELHELALRIEHVVLLERMSDEPAPPAACHGDHCHAEHGEPAGDDAVEHAAGDEGGYRPLVEAHVDRAFDLVAGQHAALSDFEPSAELPQAAIDRIELELSELRVRARVQGGDLAEPARLELDLPLDVALAAPASLAIGRDGPEHVALHVVVRLDDTLLDGIELDALAEDGSIAIAQGSPESDRVLEWLERADIDTHFER